MSNIKLTTQQITSFFQTSLCKKLGVGLITKQPQYKIQPAENQKSDNKENAEKELFAKDAKGSYVKFIQDLFEFKKSHSTSEFSAVQWLFEKLQKGNIADFLLGDFVFFINDPVLLIQTFYYFNDTKNPYWVSALETNGFVERLIDLYAPLFDYTDTLNQSQQDIILLATDLFVTLIAENKSRLMLLENIGNKEFFRIINLAKIGTLTFSIQMFRMAVRINEIIEPISSKINTNKRILYILSSFPSNHELHNIAITYAVSKIGLSISAEEIIVELSAYGEISLYDITIIDQIFREADPPSQFQAICVLFRQVICSHINRRAAMSVACQLMQYPLSQKLHQVIHILFCRIMVFIAISFKQGKYTRRALGVVESLLTDEAPEWARESINSAAAAALSKTGLSIFKLFPKQETPSTRFNRDALSFSANRVDLKTFPFRRNSSFLVERRSSVNDIVKAVEDAANRETHKAHSSSAYIYTDENATPLMQRTALYELEDFVEGERERFSQCQEYMNKLEFPNPNNFSHGHSILIRGIAATMKQVENAIHELRKNALHQYEQAVEEIRRAVETNEHTMPNIKLISSDLTRTFCSLPSYKKRIDARRRLRAYGLSLRCIITLPAYVENFVGCVKAAANLVDSTGLAPASPLDTTFEELLLHCDFTPAYNQLCEHFAMMTVDGVIKDVHQFAVTIFNHYNFKEPNELVAISQSLFRSVFNRGYSHMNDCQEDDIAVVFKSMKMMRKRFSKVAGIGCALSKGGITVKVEDAFFSKRAPHFCDLQFMTNPIDMNIKVIQECRRTFAFVGKKQSDFKRKKQVKIVAAAIACDPPVNAASVAHELDVWKGIVLSSEAVEARRLYCDAIKYLIERA